MHPQKAHPQKAHPEKVRPKEVLGEVILTLSGSSTELFEYSRNRCASFWTQT